MLETKSARPGVVTTETGRAGTTAATRDHAQDDYIRLPDGLQGRLALRPGELAEVLGIGRNAAYSLCGRTDFPKIRVGNKLLIPVDPLKRWLEDQTGVTA